MKRIKLYLKKLKCRYALWKAKCMLRNIDMDMMVGAISYDDYSQDMEVYHKVLDDAQKEYDKACEELKAL